jgi:hypothetical protein
MTKRNVAPFDPGSASGAKEPTVASSSLRTLLLLCVILLTAVVLLASAEQGGNPAAAIMPPPLSGTEAPCAVVVDPVGEQARRSESSGLAKIARYPFAPSDGLSALRLLDEAQHCYALAADAVGQARVALRAKLWRARVERDYRDHVIRYRRALAAARPELALRDIAFLEALLSHQDGPFLAQLRQAQRELEASPPTGGKP